MSNEPQICTLTKTVAQVFPSRLDPLRMAHYFSSCPTLACWSTPAISLWLQFPTPPPFISKTLEGAIVP